MTVEAHEFDTTINDLQMSPDRTYFITAGKDKSAKVVTRVFVCYETFLIMGRFFPRETWAF